MGIFSRKKEVGKPKNSLTAAGIMPGGLPFLFGTTPAGVPVNERTALQTSAVFACVKVIAEAVSGLPLHVYQHDGTGLKLAPEHPLYNILHFEPNPEMTSFTFRETMLTHALLWGNAYAQIVRDHNGRVQGLYPLDPDRVSMNRDRNGRLFYTYWLGSDEARRGDVKDGMIILDADSVMHVLGMSLNGLQGDSVIKMARNAIGLTIAAENYGASFFGNGANPGGVLEHPGHLEDAEQIREDWESNYRGNKNFQKTAILEDGMKYHAISVPPEQAQFLETRKFQITEICRIFRVPPHMVGDLDKSSFNNIEQQSLEFLKYTINPWVNRWEQAMHKSLLSPSEKGKVFIKFNVDGLLRGDYERRMRGYSTGIQNGFMSPNDARTLEDMSLIPAEEGGDNYMVNGNMTKLRDVGAAYGKGGYD